MESFESKKNILLKSKSQILKMRNTKERAEMVEAYISLLKYFCESVNESDYQSLKMFEIDGEYAEKHNNLVIKDTSRKLAEIKLNAPNLHQKFCDIIKCFQENDYCAHAYSIYAKVDSKKMMQLVWEFFASLGDDVLKLYENMIKGGNVAANNMKTRFLGYSVDPFPIDNPCVVIQNVQNYLDFYLTLVHEVGHAYQFYLQRNQKDFSSFDPYAEVTSHLFERLFLDFLKEKHEDKYCFDFEEEDYNYFLNEVSASKILCELIDNDEIIYIDPFSLDYGSVASPKELIDKLIKDCGYILVADKCLDLTKFHYSIGKAIAIYFHEKLKNNFTEEWPKYKDFLCTINYLPMSEVFDKYFDVSLVTENIKRLTKSYRER